MVNGAGLINVVYLGFIFTQRRKEIKYDSRKIQNQLCAFASFFSLREIFIKLTTLNGEWSI